MASGKKNYFRHSFFASEDAKLQSVVDSMGFEGYGFYFSLLELCGRQCADEVKNPIVFHIQTIRKVWRKNTESTKKVLKKLEESGLFLVTFSEHSVSLDIPSFGKYLGKYDSNSPNKRKEKEIKEKKIKENEIAPSALVEIEPIVKKILPEVKTQDEPKTGNVINTELFTAEPLHELEEVPVPENARNVLTALNSILGTNFRPVPKNYALINARLNEGYILSEFCTVFKHKLEQWGNNPDMRRFLRPETLLGTKFDGYLQEALGADKTRELEEEALIKSVFGSFSA
jgi:uncharacterized phage protein (TIGR02220 family)